MSMSNPDDEQHLRLLAIFHYVVGGLTTLFGLFPLPYVGFGFLILHGGFPSQSQPNQPPPFFGLFMIAFGGFFFLMLGPSPSA